MFLITNGVVMTSRTRSVAGRDADARTVGWVGSSLRCSAWQHQASSWLLDSDDDIVTMIMLRTWVIVWWMDEQSQASWLQLIVGRIMNFTQASCSKSKEYPVGANQHDSRASQKEWISMRSVFFYLTTGVLVFTHATKQCHGLTCKCWINSTTMCIYCIPYKTSLIFSMEMLCL